MEVNNEVKFIISEKGKPLALLNLYKYRLIRTRKDGFKKWLCIQKSCYCSIVTNVNLLHETTNEHNHSKNSIQSIERQVLRENCKRKASGSISVRPIKIIRTELVNSVNSEIEHRDIRSIRKAMYDKRRQIYPAFPKSLIESVEQLKSMDDNDVLKFKGDQFVFVPDNKLFVCITTEQNLNCMVDSSDFLPMVLLIMHQNIIFSSIQLIVYEMAFIYPWLIFSYLKNQNQPTLTCGYIFKN